MNIVNRYLFKTISINILFVLVILSFLFALMTLISESDKLKPDYGWADVLLFILYTTPKRMADIAPMAVLIGTLTSLGSLASNNELSVLRASGYSIAQISLNVFAVGLVLMAALLSMGEFIIPLSEQKAMQIKNPRQLTQIKEGLWLKNKNLIIKIGKVNPDKSIKDIKIYEKNNQQISREYTAKTAYEISKNEWVLQDVKILTYQQQAIKKEFKKTLKMSDLLKTNIFEVLILKADSLSIGKLLTYINYLKTNKLKYEPYQLALWQKIFSPLALFIMQALALPFIFGMQRASNAGIRIVIGSIIGISYSMLSYLISNLGLLYGIMPLISVVIPIMLFATAAFIGNKKYVFNS